MDPFLKLLGAANTILPEAKNYFFFILAATPFMMSSMVLNNQMRLQGNAKNAMIGIAAGGLPPLCRQGLSSIATLSFYSFRFSFLPIIFLDLQE